jgi:hypothetical protein
MAVTLTGTNGLFTRLGKLFQIAVQVKSAQGTLATEIQDALNEFDVGDNDHALALTGIKEAAQMSMASVYSNIRTVAHKTLIEMVHDDDPLPSKHLRAALERLIKQMEDASASINASAYAASDTAHSGNTGNGILVATTNANSLNTANTRAESIVFKCTKDAQVTGTGGREVFSVKGEMSRPDVRDYLWPGGSGTGASLTVVDPSVDATDNLHKNLLTNSDFEDFTTNTPDNWTIEVGTAGTHTAKNTTSTYIYKGDGSQSASLSIIGDASNLTKLTQSLNTAGQTTGKLRPDTMYVMFFRSYLDSGIAAGVLKASIKDSGGSTVGITNMKADTGSISLSAISAGAWNTHTVFFKTPEALPSGTPYKMTLELTTALTNTKRVYIDQMCVFRAVQVGNGPYVGLIGGSTNFVKDDEIVLAVTKSSTGTMQEYFDKFFGMYGMGLQLPENSAGSETIADSLIA